MVLNSKNRKVKNITHMNVHLFIPGNWLVPILFCCWNSCLFRINLFIFVMSFIYIYIFILKKLFLLLGKRCDCKITRTNSRIRTTKDCSEKLYYNIRNKQSDNQSKQVYSKCRHRYLACPLVNRLCVCFFLSRIIQ